MTGYRTNIKHKRPIPVSVQLENEKATGRVRRPLTMLTIRYYNYWNVEGEKRSTNSTTTPHLSESVEQRVEVVSPQAEELSVIFGDMEGPASRVGVGSWCALSSSVSPGAAGKEGGEVEPLHRELG